MLMMDWLIQETILTHRKNPENENQKKIVEIFEKILAFNKQQKGKGI